MPGSLLLRSSAVPRATTGSSLALGSKGFRPFFLLAASFALAIVPLWLLILRGAVRAAPYLDGVSFHAHEMIFGLVVAVVAGFLLTAVGNWTQRETAVGAPLFALAALWLAGRLAMLLAAALPRGVVALADLAFLPALMLVLARPLVAARNRRNFVMLGILAALFLTNLGVHLEALGVASTGTARRASLVAVDLVLVLITVIA
ncbi:MAG TPA: NnrS family protein, partial [Polyangiaceae bacterium]|nr:NnrS family protein [Polyangiaceae bacterium]